jgi:hypothetical protein
MTDDENSEAHERGEPVGATEVILKLLLTIIFYIYECHRKDLHLLSHFGEVNT